MFERCNKRFTSGDSVSVQVELCHVVLCGSPAHRDSLKATVFMVRSRPALAYTCFATGLTAMRLAVCTGAILVSSRDICEKCQQEGFQKAEHRMFMWMFGKHAIKGTRRGISRIYLRNVQHTAILSVSLSPDFEDESGKHNVIEHKKQQLF